MKQRFISLLATVFLSAVTLCAGVYINAKGKYGYIDEARGINIPCKYDYMTEFSPNGVAIVQKRNKWGCINTYGSTVIKNKYQYISDFENGYAKVSSSDGLGLIDDRGNFILPTSYGFIKPFNKAGLSIMGSKDGLVGVLDRNCKTICGFGHKIAYYDEENNLIDITPDMDTIPGNPEYFYKYDTEAFYYVHNGKHLYVERADLRRILMQKVFGCTGQDAMPEISGWSEFSDGVVKFTTTVNVSGNSSECGIAIAYYKVKGDKFLTWVKFFKRKADVRNGDTFKGTNLFKIYKFNHGYGCYTLVDVQGRKKSTIIDINGNIVRTYPQAFGFSDEGYMIVEDSITGDFGVVNSDFNYVISPQYSSVKFYKDQPVIPPFGKVLVKKDGLWGEIDLHGNIIIPFKYKESFYSTAGGLIGYSNDGETYGLMKDNGEVVTACKFKNIYVSQSPGSVCCRHPGYGSKIYAFNTVTGDSTVTGYDIFVKAIKANPEHGGQIFILGNKNYNDTTYSLIDGNLNLIVDKISSKVDAFTIALDESQKPFKQMSTIDIKRYRLSKTANRRKYSVINTISEENWDY